HSRPGSSASLLSTSLVAIGDPFVKPLVRYRRRDVVAKAPAVAATPAVKKVGKLPRRLGRERKPPRKPSRLRRKHPKKDNETGRGKKRRNQTLSLFPKRSEGLPKGRGGSLPLLRAGIDDLPEFSAVGDLLLLGSQPAVAPNPVLRGVGVIGHQ